MMVMIETVGKRSRKEVQYDDSLSINNNGDDGVGASVGWWK